MATFPTLICSPSVERFAEELSDETVQIASKASGLPVLNKLYTFDPKTWDYILNFVSQTDKKTLFAFYEANKDIPFNWLNEQDGATYEVIFIGPPRCRTNGEKDHWKIRLTLTQYSPL